MQHQPAPVPKEIPEHFCKHLREIRKELFDHAKVGLHVKHTKANLAHTQNKIVACRRIIDEQHDGNLKLHRVVNDFEASVNGVRDRVNKSLKLHDDCANAILGKIRKILVDYGVETKEGKCTKKNELAPLTVDEAKTLRLQVADISQHYAIYRTHRDTLIAASTGHSFAPINEGLDGFGEALKQAGKLG